MHTLSLLLIPSHFIILLVLFFWSFSPCCFSSTTLTPSLFLPHLALSLLSLLIHGLHQIKIDTSETAAIVCYENGNGSDVVIVNDLAHLSNQHSHIQGIILCVSPSCLCRVMIMMRGCRW